jgi:hypothetical protein
MEFSAHQNNNQIKKELIAGQMIQINVHQVEFQTAILKTVKYALEVILHSA